MKIILSLDPSSSVIGYAVMRMDGQLLEHGLITPDNKRAISYERIRCMRKDLVKLLNLISPDIILVEWTKGKVGKRRHKGQGAGLAVYGSGMGSVLTTCDIWAETRNTQVTPILENDWTRGVRKEERTLAVAQQFPDYKPASDPGDDKADAIGMAWWWILHTHLIP